MWCRSFEDERERVLRYPRSMQMVLSSTYTLSLHRPTPLELHRPVESNTVYYNRYSITFQRNVISLVCKNWIHREQRRHSNRLYLWSRYDLYVVGQLH